MKREQKEILKLLDDQVPRTALEIADELFKDPVRIIALCDTLKGRRYLCDYPVGDGEWKRKITNRGARFIAKFPDFQIS